MKRSTMMNARDWMRFCYKHKPLPLDFNICLSVCVTSFCLCLSVCVSVCLSLSLCLFSRSVCMFVSLSVFMSVSVCICLSVCLCLFVSFHLSLSVSVFISLCLCVGLTIYLVCVYISVCLCVSPASLCAALSHLDTSAHFPDYPLTLISLATRCHSNLLLTIRSGDNQPNQVYALNLD